MASVLSLVVSLASYPSTQTHIIVVYSIEQVAMVTRLHLTSHLGTEDFCPVSLVCTFSSMTLQVQFLVLTSQMHCSPLCTLKFLPPFSVFLILIPYSNKL